MIDCHLHIGHFDRSPQDTLQHIEATGACCAYILPVDDLDREFPFATEKVWDLHQSAPDQVIPACCVDPRRENALSKIEAYHDQGFVGYGELKVRMACDDPRSIAVFRLCGELGMPVTIHFQEHDFNTGFLAFRSVLEACPDTVFIGHAQTWWAHISADVPDRDYYPTGKVVERGLTDRWLSDHENLYGDLSAGSGHNAISRDPEFTPGFLERHHHKLLFATDCPCRDGKGDGWTEDYCFAQESLPVLQQHSPNETALNDVLHDNAARLFDRPPV